MLNQYRFLASSLIIFLALFVMSVVRANALGMGGGLALAGILSVVAFSWWISIIAGLLAHLYVWFANRPTRFLAFFRAGVGIALGYSFIMPSIFLLAFLIVSIWNPISQVHSNDSVRYAVVGVLVCVWAVVLVREIGAIVRVGKREILSNSSDV